ncbi:MAG: XrtB/PEP-CTERM-associated polysaccharide biosynthesis outer membrane protein EpsL [Burkholderiales bacterium]
MSPRFRRNVLKGRIAATAIVATMLAGNATADDGDVLMGRVAANVLSDSNVFRISKNSDPATAAGATHKDDLITRLTAGGRLDAPYRQQRFVGHLDLSKVKYQHFDALDHDAIDQRLAWRWAAGSDLNGEISESYSRSLAGFANFESRIKNIIDVLQADARANYKLTPRWQLEGAVAHTRIRNNSEERRANDTNELAIEAGFKYLAPAGDFAGITARTSDANYPNRVVESNGVFSADYTQRGIDFVVDRRLWSHSRLGGRYGYVRRQYSSVSQRDYSGPTGSLSLDWTPGAKSQFTASARRELGAFQDFTTSYYLGDGLTARAVWLPSTRVSLNASYDWQRRRFLGDPGFFAGAGLERRDIIRTASIGVTYRVSRTGQLGLSLSREDRTTNFPLADYAVNLLGASASIAF